MRERGGQQIHAALLQLGQACGHGKLLEHGLHADALGHGVAHIDVVADDLAAHWVFQEAERLVGAEHAADEFTFLLDVGELVGMGGGGDQGGSGQDGSAGNLCQTSACFHWVSSLTTWVVGSA